MMTRPHSVSLSYRPRWWKSMRLSFGHARLQDRLRYMSVLRAGSVSECCHSRLRTGFLVEDIFLCCGGNDILCQDCRQVWVATEMSEQYEFSLSAAAQMGEQKGIQ